MKKLAMLLMVTPLWGTEVGIYDLERIFAEYTISANHQRGIRDKMTFYQEQKDLLRERIIRSRKITQDMAMSESLREKTTNALKSDELELAKVTQVMKEAFRKQGETAKNEVMADIEMALKDVCESTGIDVAFAKVPGMYISKSADLTNDLLEALENSK
jgi:Skp family chaperone for outer membrane proteins